MAVPGNFTGGLTVATGDLNNDGTREIIVGFATGPTIVQTFSNTGVLESAFRAFDAYYNTGVHVATADTTGSGSAQILVTSGLNFGGAPLRRYKIDGSLQQQLVTFEEGFLGGAFVG